MTLIDRKPNGFAVTWMCLVCKNKNTYGVMSTQAASKLVEDLQDTLLCEECSVAPVCCERR